MTVDAAAAAQQVADPSLSGNGLPTDALPQDILGQPIGATQPYANAGTETALDKLQQQQEDQASAQLNLDMYGTAAGGFDGQSAGLTGGAKSISQKIIQAAEHYLGTPYEWGQAGASGVDCSGLVQLAYKAAGINLPRVSFQQANAGKAVGLNALRPGDLVAWNDSSRNPGADHIAIYLGGGMIIEAAHPGTNVRIRRLGKTGFDAHAYGVQMGW